MVLHVDETYTILPTHIRPRKIQPGKKTILVSLSLSVMLLMSQLFRALQLSHPPHLLPNTQSMQSLTSLNEEVEVEPCIRTQLGASLHQAESQQACHHLAPPRGLCSLMQTLFFTNKPKTCQHQTTVTFCTTMSGRISCVSPLQCNSLRHYIGVFDEREGRTKWKEINPTDLKIAVEKEINEESYYGYLFIKCTSESIEAFEQSNAEEMSYGDYVQESAQAHTQLFLYPKRLRTQGSSSSPNINLVMIDSLSRPHFYRSLPETVKYFEDLYGRTHRQVFDFEFVQAVKQRTYESLQALFSGYVNATETPFGTYDIPRKPLPVSDLFKAYKNKGFKTLWLEDLCWTWEWGLVKDLKVVNVSETRPTWSGFKSALSIANIDSVDVTLASCDILEVTGKKDPFHDVPAVCFNGRYHHEYLLEYLKLYQETAQTNNQSFITYTVSHVAHDETGVRVQSLDHSLVEYMKFAAKLKNTVTILFSDHGNTYGQFLQSSPEAHVETFNPFLFLLIPKSVQDSLTPSVMKALKGNEKSLVSLIDVHYMLLRLLGIDSRVSDREFAERFITPGGLLSEISLQRTCSDIPLLQPNLCICKNFESTVKPSDLHSALADFSIGTLNNMILQQYTSQGGTGFGNCVPLRPIEIRKVLEVRVSVFLIRYKIDVAVHGFKDSSEKEIFFFTVESDSNKNSLRLVSYERISLYGTYAKCRDEHVELKLCVCDAKRHKGTNGFLASLIFGNLIENYSLFGRKTSGSPGVNELLSQTIFDVKPQIDVVYPENNNACLFTIAHSYKYGILLYAANYCNANHNLEIMIEAENVNLSCGNNKNPQFLVKSKDVVMLVAGTQANPKVAWHWNHRVQLQIT